MNKPFIITVINKLKDPDERGAALVTALMFLLILTMLGMASIMTSGTEVMISRNDRLNKLALNHANAGAQAAMCLLDDGVIGSNKRAINVTMSDMTTVWTVDPADVGMTDMNFTVTVRYRAEDLLHQYSGVNGQAVAYSRDMNYSKSPYASRNFALPVFVVTSEGWVGDATNKLADAKVVIEVTKNTLNVQAPGGMFAGGCVDFNGDPTVAGNVYMNDPAACPPLNNPNVSPSTSAQTTGSYINMTSYMGVSINEVSDLATIPPINITTNTTTNGANYGSEPDNPAIVYTTVDPSVTTYKLNGLTGYGILVVKGKVELGGGLNWKGLIYVIGELTIAGGGATPLQVQGAIMATGSMTTMNGANVTVTYDQAVLDGIGSKAFHTKIINWKRLYN